MDEGIVKPRQYPNIPALFGFLISAGVCSLDDLRHKYSYGDAMYMFEAVMVPRYNEWREQKARENRSKK